MSSSTRFPSRAPWAAAEGLRAHLHPLRSRSPHGVRRPRLPGRRQRGLPGNLGYNKQLKTLIDEGATVYGCRFAMGALYGMREDDLIKGVIPFNPLDVLDANIQAWCDRAMVFSTWMV